MGLPVVRRTLFLCAACLLSLAPAATAQGTRSDYERANALSRRFAGKVFRASVSPQWIGGSGRFWYRNDLPGGRREFILVDPAQSKKERAFDHARLAGALSKLLQKPVAADRLPVDRIAFPENSPFFLAQVQEKTYECDLTTYALREAKESLGRAQARSPRSGPRHTRRTGGETSLTFINRTSEEITLYWLDFEGRRREYGKLAPGATRAQHTFAGHVWLAARSRDGRPLAVFEGQESPSVAVIDGDAGEERGAPAPDPALSPDGKWRALIRNQNVVLVEQATGKETPLTQDGSAQDAYGGTPIWSPDSRRFVLLQTIPAQERKVYVVESSPKDQLQPKLHSFDYLKPGDRIARPRPRLFDVVEARRIPVPETLFADPWEISDIRWDPDSKRFTFLYNQRGHQVMRLVAVDADTGAPSVLIEEQAKTFIDWTNKVFLRRLERTQEAIWMSERDGWNHLYLYDTAAGRVKNQITKGEWVVRGVDRVDADKRQIWFRAGGIRPGQDPYYIHYCRVNFDGSGLTILTEGNGTHSVQFSPDRRYLVDSYSRVDMPPVTELRRAEDGSKVMDLERGDESALVAAGWRRPERFVAKGRDGKTDIYGVIYRPTNFNPSIRYPIIEAIYAGPHGSHVPKSFSAFHGTQELAELGFIVVQIDGMGTSNRSKAFHDVCWKNLADAGFPDRILWIKAAAKKYPYMDISRVGIYGTSAGGQNALGGLLLHGDFYKVGVADCGCHDNRMDKIWWNEQWMGYPVGPHYAEQSNVTLAPRLKGKLLLMVGEMDSNVDPASTMQVVNALIQANRDFDLIVFPGAGHGVAGTSYGKRRLQDFFVRHLLGVEPRSESVKKRTSSAERGYFQPVIRASRSQ
jgi:dipeptidyl aminopeptidase/acylaminoacyl peptidase